MLRLGAPIGAVAAGTLELRWTYASWVGATLLALAVLLGNNMIRRRHFTSSGMPTVLQHCADIQQRLCLWDRQAMSRPLRIDSDVKSTVQRVLVFEEQLPMERLKLDFFAERRDWRRRLAEASDYDVVLSHIAMLKAAISEPLTRLLTQQVLARKQAAIR